MMRTLHVRHLHSPVREFVLHGLPGELTKVRILLILEIVWFPDALFH